jgi:hypothetical protein
MRPSEAAAQGLVNVWGERAPRVLSELLYAFPEGSLALRAIEVYCGMNAPVPVKAGNEALQRMEGRREMYLWLKAVLSLTAEEVASLTQTNNGDDDDAS